jgi:hypothetical protein
MQKILIAIALLTASFCATGAMAATLNSSTTLVDQRDASPQNIAQDEPQFARIIDDLPLTPGLEPVPEEDVLFVTPGVGRIAETSAQGMVDIDEVYNFYKRSLPHLGWRAMDARTYRRDGEVLRIDAHADGKVTTVNFSVRPNEHK